MTEQTILSLAQKEGFEAKIIPTEELVFDSTFRKYCEQNLCGNYASNYTCPPVCGEVQELKERLLSYPRVLVLKSCHNIESYEDAEKIERAKGEHNAKTARLYKEVSAEKSALAIGCSACKLCSPCKIVLSEHCPHPELALLCLSAFCVNVKELSEKCGMQYAFEDKKLSLFGMIALR